MTGARTRTFALAIAALGVAVLAVAAFALRDAARERFFIWRLGSRDESVRQSAIERLGEIGSARVIPALLEAMASSLPPQPDIRTGGIRKIFPESDGTGASILRITRRSFPRAQAQLKDVLSEERWEVRLLVACVLLHIEGNQAGLGELLYKVRQDEMKGLAFLCPICLGVHGETWIVR